MGSRLLTRLLLPQFILMAPLARFLVYHRYDPTRREAIVEIALVVVLGAAAALLLWRGGPRIRAATLAALLLIFIDLSFTLGQHLPRLVQSVIPIQTGWTALAALAVGFAVLYGVVRALGAHGESVLAVVFGVVLASTVVFGGDGASDRVARGEAREARRDLPLVVHLVLDEHGAYSTPPDEIDGASEVRRGMAALYVDNGFRLWSRAFSRSSATEVSMTATFNAIRDLSRDLPLKEGTGGFFAYTMTANAYFDEMARRGWRIHAIQGNHIDYCAIRPSVVESCRTFAASSPRAMMDADQPFVQKLVVLHSLYWRGSFLYYAALRAYRRLQNAIGGLPSWPHRDNVAPMTSMAMFDQVLATARKAGRGAMVFAHLYVPHHPYAFKADCALRPYDEEWLLLGDSGLPPPKINTVEGWRLRYRLYGEQVRCMNRALAKLFDGLRAAGLWDDSIVIVQGDHGSRITLVEPDAENRASLTAGDLRDNFLTHMAVKMPGLNAGFERTPQAIQDIVPHLMMGRPMPVAEDYVFLSMRSQPGQFLRVPLSDIALPAQ